MYLHRVHRKHALRHLQSTSGMGLECPSVYSGWNAADPFHRSDTDPKTSCPVLWSGKRFLDFRIRNRALLHLQGTIDDF